ncbi:MAG: VIT domain-containing protein [Planctomycetaceae bacterium]
MMNVFWNRSSFVAGLILLAGCTMVISGCGAPDSAQPTASSAPELSDVSVAMSDDAVQLVEESEQKDSISEVDALRQSDEGTRPSLLQKQAVRSSEASAPAAEAARESRFGEPADGFAAESRKSGSPMQRSQIEEKMIRPDLVAPADSPVLSFEIEAVNMPQEANSSSFFRINEAFSGSGAGSGPAASRGDLNPMIFSTSPERPRFALGLDLGLSSEQQKTLQINLQPGEELWVIAKAVDSQGQPDPDVPGCGSLMAVRPGETTQVAVPLKHTAVQGSIDAYIATVDVTQQFYNPYDSKIEAVYVFPLPQNAAVSEFVMTVGERKIRGIIREREQAEKIYSQARAQGHVAALMTQERPNIFTQKVANIEPGKQIDINIRYFNTLQYDDGYYEFVFPMVVGPRFNPAGTTDGIAAVPRGQANGHSGQSTEVSYLAPNERSGHDVSVSLKISAGVDIEDINSVNHAVDVKNICESQRTVTLSEKDSIPNKDFVVRYRVAGDRIKTALMTHQDDRGQYFTMMLYPPADLGQIQRSPMEMVFVLDCSGSMYGQPIAQAKAAIRHAVQQLTPRDSFQIIRFSNNASQLGPDPLQATTENIAQGLKYLETLEGSGGTQMIEGIKAALDFPHDEGRFRLVSFMTDGCIGNEQQILGTIHDKLGASRIFSFGVGSSPNRFLMDRMAVLGRGAVAYLSLSDNATEIMDRFNQRISHPAMTDLSIDWGSMQVSDVYPTRLPDLIVGRPVILTGRFTGEASTVKVNGRVDMNATSFDVAVNEDEAASKSHAGIASVWARLKISDLMNTLAVAPDSAEDIRQSVTATALSYNLMSSFTSFVAVDSMTKTQGEFGTTVAVPVPVPDGVKYETTVGGTN